MHDRHALRFIMWFGRCMRSAAIPAAGHCGAAASYAAASPNDATTTYYDGVYVGSFTQNMSAAGSGCPDCPVAPSLTIRNGVAQFAALDLRYQGYVSPAGEVIMQNLAGQILVGHIDPYYKLAGQTIGGCVYNAVWQRRRQRDQSRRAPETRPGDPLRPKPPVTAGSCEGSSVQ